MKEIAILRQGGVGVFPTDTLYGLLGSALQRKTVERIYKLRKRNLRKPCIILIGSSADVQKFGIRLNVSTKRVLSFLWPGPVSVVLPVPFAKWRYLHRGTQSLAFRVPKPLALRRLLQKTGPLLAPSANVEGADPVETIAEARTYFGDRIDFYAGRGRRQGKPSTLIDLRGGRAVVLRQGSLSTRVRELLEKNYAVIY